MILEIEGLTKSFGGLLASDNVQFGVEEGNIHAIIGPNGAGKTTLFNLITGYYKPDSGRVIFQGDNITGLPSYEICRRGIGRSFQVINIYPKLSTFRNVQVAIMANAGLSLNMYSAAKDKVRKETERILETVGLLEQKELAADSLAHGDKKRLELAIALGNLPKLLLLDEPTAGMSHEETTATVHLIETLAHERNLTILFTEHDMTVVFGIARRITVLHQGTVIADGEPGDIKRNDQVQKVYLGE